MAPRLPGETVSLDLPLRLTLVELLLRPVAGWYLRPVLLLFAGLGLLFPAALRSPATWLGITLFTGARVVREWPAPDNHFYLLTYWCLALTLALLAPRPSESAAISGRWLLALVFVFAALWKGVLAPDYLDGRFFRVTLLTDERFERTAQLFGGLAPGELAENRAYLKPLPEGVELVDPPRLTEPPALRRLARLSTWGTLAAEAAMALAYLLPWGRWTTAIRHGLTIGFCAVTYAFAPVSGFGWLVAVLGLGQVPAEQRLWRAAYVAVWFLILFYGDIPWARLALDWTRGDAGTT